RTSLGSPLYRMDVSGLSSRLKIQIGAIYIHLSVNSASTMVTDDGSTTITSLGLILKKSLSKSRYSIAKGIDVLYMATSFSQSMSSTSPSWKFLLNCTYSDPFDIRK